MRTRAFRADSLDSNNNDRTYISLEPALQWSLTRWWSVKASYRYRWEKRDELNSSVDSNGVLVSLTYERPFEKPSLWGK
jgi:hypothetical protein